MPIEIDDLLLKLKQLEDEIEERVESSRTRFFETIEKGKAKFTAITLEQHRALKLGIDKYIFRSKLATVLSAPFIYAMIVPFVFLDLSLFFYQLICFSAWQLPKVKRSEYIVIDRQYLQYLNILEKINCVYCGYGNGLMAYGREIAARTEQYWCPIKHASKTKDPHGHYRNFVEYGDAESYKAKLEELREMLRAMGK